MKAWWADTLFKRLFLLMWFGLVASHLLAFVVVTRVHAPPGAAGRGIGELPVLPSLPPIGAARDDRPAPGPPPDRFDAPAPSAASAAAAPRGGAPAAPPRDGLDAGPPGGLPAGALWLDYAVRFVAIGIVAWFGARWLSRPMHRLAEASEDLGRALGRQEPTPPLDVRHGTLEVRQTAQVFNTMAQRLRAQFDAQTLLLAAISHDLRTPLARLRLRLETMDPQPQTARSIADVHEMDALIGSVLGLLRDQQAPGDPERVDLAALVQALIDDLVEQGEAAQLLDMPSPQPAAALVRAPPAALNRVLANLVGNALRHGGVARVSVQARDRDVQVVIDDDGPGIPPGQLEAVRRPFYRIDGSRRAHTGGSGLGLYIAHDLAERHGGRVHLSNRPEGGLRAELVLPRAA